MLVIFGEIFDQIFYTDLNIKYTCLDFSDFKEIFIGIFQLSFKCCYSIAKAKSFHVSDEKKINNLSFLFTYFYCVCYFFISGAIYFWILAIVYLYKTLNHESLSSKFEVVS